MPKNRNNAAIARAVERTLSKQAYITPDIENWLYDAHKEPIFCVDFCRWYDINVQTRYKH